MGKGRKGYEFSMPDDEWSGGASPSDMKHCSLLVTIVIAVVTGLVLSAVVGVAVAFGRSCDSLDVEEPDVTQTTQLPPTSAPTLGPPNGDELLLPKTLTPLHYDLRLRPRLYSTADPVSSFNGTVNVTFRVDAPTDVITIHAKESLNITGWSASHVIKSDENVTSTPRLEFLHVHLESQLTPGTEAWVELEFEGPISPDLAGIYRSSYMVGNETKYLVTSHLHPTEARKVFPCFDEPALKAIFTVTLERRSDVISLSNTHIVDNTTLEDGWVADHYAPSPPMSTYLLAFVVADFSCNETTTEAGKSVWVCSRPNAMDQAEYAVSVAGRILDFLEEYYNVSYPLSRMVHVAVPDFPAGAMENWGCILYRETSLLYDPITSSTANKQRVASVIAHETAHMWFGDLVTPAWWDDIWLNEGFASYMEYPGVNSVEPRWDMDDQFLNLDLQPVLQTDSLASSHPIYQEVSHPDEINELFDSISYNKGASVIRMMRYFLTEDIFKAGITNYLQDKAFNVTHHTDLFRTLTETADAMGSDVNVTRVMLTWILQMGYPVVHMSYDATTGNVNMSQTHFLMNKQDNGTLRPSPYDYLWEVPISIATDLNGFEEDELYSSWLNESTGEMNITVGAQWIVGNPFERYFYRVTYDEYMWAELSQQLLTNHSMIPAASRAQLIDDSFSLARPGVVQQSLAMNLSLYLDQELDYVPWTAASRSFSYIRRMLATGLALPYLQTYVQKQVKPVYNISGWNEQDEEEHLLRLLQVLAVNLACEYGMNECLDKASTFYKDLMESTINDSALNVNLRSAVYCNGIKAGGIAEWKYAFDLYSVSNVATDRSMLLGALACTQHAYILAEYLELAMEGTSIRQQDFATVIIAVSRNINGQQLAWDRLRLEWDTIYRWFGSTSLYTLSNIVSGVTESFSTAQRLKELEDFVKLQEGNLGSAERAFQQAIEYTGANIDWRRRNEAEVTDWLKTQTAP